jgi:transcriptional regulator with XRE-family HTH domain
MRGILVNAKRFRQLRYARGLTQRELAHLAGIGERTVRNAEAGRPVRLEFLTFLATALGVDVTDVVDDRDELRTALREQRRVEHILEAIEAHAKERDYTELQNLVSQDVVLNSPGPSEIPFAGEYRGIDGLRTFFDRSAASIAYDQIPEILHIRTGGNLVVVSGFDRLRAIATGKSVSGPWMHVYEFNNGHIVRIDNWGCIAEIQNALQPG